MQNRFKSILIALGFLTYLNIQAVTIQAEEQIKIGLITPLSGNMSEVGAAFRDAALLATKDLSAEGSIVQLVVEDDQLSSRAAASAAQKLIAVDKVDGIISTWSYGGSVVAPIAEKNKIPHIGIAWDPTIARGKFNFMHLTPPSEFLRLFLEIFKAKGLRKIASFGLEESGSIFALEELKRLAPKYSIEIVDSTLFPFVDYDLRSALQKSISKSPDALFANLSTPTIDQFISTARQLKYTGEITSITGFDVTPDLSKIEGSWYVSDSYLDPAFAKRFKDKFNHKITYGVGNFYDSVRLLFWLINGVKDSKQALDQQLLKIVQFKSLFGALKIDAEGIISYTPTYLKICEGKRVPVSANEILNNICPNPESNSKE